MSKGWIVALVGVLSVLGFAAYLSLRPQTQPAAGFRVAVNPGASQPASSGQPVQTASSPAPSSGSAVQATRLPAPAPSPSIVRARVVTPIGNQYSYRHHALAQVRSAGETSSAAPASSSAVPAIAESPNSGSGPQVVALNAPPSPPPEVPATPASAVLVPHGSVLLNGKPAVDSTALFPGDRIQVPGNAYASISGNGSLTVLQPGASLVYTPQELKLQAGGVAVSTLTGMPVNAEGLTVVPRTGHGKYDVLDDNGSVQIASLEGDLNIMDGGQATLLPAGQQTTRDRRKKAADAPADGPPAPETPPATASGGFPTGKVLLITGAVAGGVVAAVLLTRSSSSKPVSPAVP